MKSCLSCIHFAPNPEGREERSGFCHRYPPAVFLKGEDYRSLFAPVRADFACGEHKPAEPCARRRRRRAA
jgi:hypothetical protein